MAASGFARAMARVQVHEGGKVDDPADPGGRTNQGVTQRVYNAYRARKGLPIRDVYLMEPHERDEIYRFQYWNVIKGDQLPPGLDYVVFDGAVNSGPVQSVKWLQRALGVELIDGNIGTATLRAIEECEDHDRLIALICDRRMAFLRSLKTWGRFGKGWSSRVNSVEVTGQAWAMGSVGPAVSYIPNGDRKATIADAKPMPVKAAADIATTSGVASGGTASAINQAKDAIEPYTMLSEHIATIFTVLVVAGVVLTVGGLAWRAWANHRAKKLSDALDLPKGVAA